MARRGSATTQEELYSTPDEPAREELDDARLLDLDAEKESPFLRAQKRVPARRSPLPKKTAAKILWVLLAIVVAGVGAFAAKELYRYGQQSWRFRLNSSDEIELSGLSNVTRAQVMEVMRDDLAKNVFSIPLSERQKQLQQIPWVESASVMRFAPNRIKIQIKERTPVAFAQIGSKILLADAGGVLMDLSSKKKYSFPVILGMGASEPLSTRAAQMKIYNQLMGELDSGGTRYSQDLSEVDLSDPDDVKILTNDPDGEVLVHMGSSNYLDRYKTYVAGLRGWRQQFPMLDSVDLRYDRQIIVNPDLRGTERQAPLSAKAAQAAIAAGVKPAVLIQHETPKQKLNPAAVHPAQAPLPSRLAKSTLAKGGAKHPVKKAHAGVAHKTLAHPAKASAHKGAIKLAVEKKKTVTAKTPPTSSKPSPAIAKRQDSR